MRRIASEERPDWRARAEETGFDFHTLDGQRYAGRRYFGLARGASYEAAKRGDIPVLRIGRLKRVPVRALEKMLDKAGASHD